MLVLWVKRITSLPKIALFPLSDPKGTGVARRNITFRQRKGSVSHGTSDILEVHANRRWLPIGRDWRFFGFDVARIVLLRTRINGCDIRLNIWLSALLIQVCSKRFVKVVWIFFLFALAIFTLRIDSLLSLLRLRWRSGCFGLLWSYGCRFDAIIFFGLLSCLLDLRGHSFKLFVRIPIIIVVIHLIILTFIFLLLKGCNWLRIINILIYRIISRVDRSAYWLLFSWHRWSERHNAESGPLLLTGLQIGGVSEVGSLIVLGLYLIKLDIRIMINNFNFFVDIWCLVLLLNVHDTIY